MSASGLFGVTLLVMIGGVGLSFAYGSSIDAVPDTEAIGAGLYAGLLLFAIPGLLLSLRKPSHPIGWLLLGFALSWSALGASVTYVVAGALTEHGPFGGMEWIALIANSAWVFGFLCLGLVIFLFPTGAPPTRRWRWVIPTGLVATGLIVSALTLHPNLDPDIAVVNPIGWRAGAPVLDIVLGLGYLLQYLVAASVAVSIIVRFRNSRGVERQQLAFLTLAVSVATIISIGLSIRDAIDVGSNTGLGFEVVQFVGLLAAGFVPVAIVIAIMRYGLFDLGRIINRTIVYAIVLLLLAGVYAAGVFATTQLLPISDTSFGIASSTLVVAALFNPIRRRAQRFVSSRLYRSSYDATELLETLRTDIRNVVDVDEISSSLITVVERAFRPTKISIWIRERQTDPTDR